jgi:hypothetical protein
MNHKQIREWENEFDKRFPDIISLGALQERDLPDLEFRIKDFIKELLKAKGKWEPENVIGEI